MFLHLGADTVVPVDTVIAITDIKTVNSVINREFLKMMKDEKMVCDISENDPKSFIITDKTVYLSAISSLTLKKRAGTFPDEEDNYIEDRKTDWRQD